jgi:hypothetical protein
VAVSPTSKEGLGGVGLGELEHEALYVVGVDRREPSRQLQEPAHRMGQRERRPVGDRQPGRHIAER